MTRVIAGSAKGRSLKVPKSGTRPTSDRVRESVFGLLDHRLGDWSRCRVLDLFAGSGAYAIEAMSRGAAAAVCVERAKAAAEVIRANAVASKCPVELAVESVERFVSRPAAAIFDVVFVDPPYELDSNLVSELLAQLVANGYVGAGSWAVVERSSRSTPISEPPGVVKSELRKYGETALFVLGW